MKMDEAFGTFAALSDEEIAAERNIVPVRPHIVAQNPNFPLLGLSDRQFELLAHALLQADISLAAEYDRASILLAGADRGRDILLLKNGVVHGVAQCKRYSRPLSAARVLIELLKFALFAARDSALVPASSQPFAYQLWTASGLSDEARELFDFPASFREMLLKNAPMYAAKARGSLLGLTKPEDEDAATAELNSAIKIASSFSLTHVGPEIIGPRLMRNPHVRRWFFRSPEDGPSRAQASEIDSLIETFRRERLAELNAKGMAGAITYIPRSGMADALDDFLANEARLFVLVGGSGQGKTSWAARLLERPPAGWSVDVVKAEEISPDDDIVTQTIARFLLSRRMDGVPTYDFARAVWDWLDASNRILIIDGLDRARATVRETLADWLRTTVALTRRASLRIVITSRREAWSTIFSQLSDLDPTLYRPELTGGRGQASFELGKLNSVEAEEFYVAYGVSAHAHRSKRLSTPGLIARFSRLASQTTDSIITRADVLLADVADLRKELRSKPSVGILGSEQLLDRLGRTLLDSIDGHVPLGAVVDGPASEAALEALLAGDRAVVRDGLVRLESDDTTELLMGHNLDVETAVTRLAYRSDPLFIGAIAMMIAKIESEAPDKVAAVLDRFLEEAPRGRSPQLDALSRSILELRNPSQVRRHIASAVALWNQPNFLLPITNLAALLDEVALPPSERFALMRPLVSGEDTDDWRDKYWLSPDLHGRLKTPFADVASRIVAEDPEALIPLLLKMIIENVGKDRPIATGLLREAAVRSPQFSLRETWQMPVDGNVAAFGIVASSIPAAAARFLATVRLDTIQSRRRVVEWIRQLAHSAPLGQTLPPDVSLAILAAADQLREKLDEPALKARIIIVRLLQQGDRDLEQELVKLWSEVCDDDYWFGIEVVGAERVRLLADLLEGRDGRRNAGHFVSQMYRSVFSDADLGAVVPLFARFSETGIDGARYVARAVEVLLYEKESTEGNLALWDLARKLAASNDDQTRRPLIYYAGSACRHDPGSLEIIRRNNLLGILIDKENGEHVKLLVWKLIDSASERQNAVEYLVRLSTRFGRERILEVIDDWDFLPGAEEIREAFKRAFEEGPTT